MVTNSTRRNLRCNKPFVMIANSDLQRKWYELQEGMTPTVQLRYTRKKNQIELILVWVTLLRIPKGGYEGKKALMLRQPRLYQPKWIAGKVND